MKRPSPRHSHRRLGVATLTVALAVLLAACNPHFGDTVGPVQRGVITSPTGETYGYATDDGATLVSADGANTDPNIRELFWNEEGPYLADQQVCQTWHTRAGSIGGDISQPGLALRIAPSGPDGTGVKGITVNENIWFAAIWIFWVNVWDSSNTDQPFQGVKSFDLSPIVGKIWVDDDGPHTNMVPPPWHVCARTQSSSLTFKVWTGTNPEPGWDDPDHVFGTDLPEGWDHPGYTGGYMGHLEAGQTAVISTEQGTPLCLEPDMIDSAYCLAEFEDLAGAGTG